MEFFVDDRGCLRRHIFEASLVQRAPSSILSMFSARRTVSPRMLYHELFNSQQIGRYRGPRLAHQAFESRPDAAVECTDLRGRVREEDGVRLGGGRTIHVVPWHDMAPGVSSPCVINTVGVLDLRQAGLGAECVDPLCGNEIVRRELVGCLDGHAFPEGLTGKDLTPFRPRES